MKTSLFLYILITYYITYSISRNIYLKHILIILIFLSQVVLLYNMTHYNTSIEKRTQQAIVNCFRFSQSYLYNVIPEKDNKAA